MIPILRLLRAAAGSDRDLLDRYVRTTGVKKGHLLEEALLHHLRALDALPADVMTIGVDLNIKHLLYQRDRSRAMRVVADANQLPFRDDSVDVVTSSHF